MLEDKKLDTEVSVQSEGDTNRDYNLDMVIAFRSGAIANRHVNPRAVRQMQIESYNQKLANK